MRAYSEELQGQVQKIIDEGADIHRRIGEVSATVVSENGLVEVTSDGRGQVTELRLSPEIYRRPNSRELAESILETIRAAVDKAVSEAQEIAAEVVPRQSLDVYRNGEMDSIVENMTSRMFGKD